MTSPSDSPDHSDDLADEQQDQSDDSRQRPDAATLARNAALFARRSASSTGRGTSNLAREFVEGTILAVGEVGGETTAFVRDAVIGTMQGTAQALRVTTPAVRETVIGAIRGSRKTNVDAAGANREAVEGAIVGATSIGIDSVDAAHAAVEGAVVAVKEVGGDIEDAAATTIGGVVSGVTSAGGNVAGATRDSAHLLIASAAGLRQNATEISNVASSVMDAVIQEAESTTHDVNDVVSAAAQGAVVAAYEVGQSEGDRVRNSILRRIADPGRAIAPELSARLVEVAEQLSTELPRGRGAWRGMAMVKAVRILIEKGGIDLAASLAYFTIMSFFPLITLIIMIAAFFADPADIRATLTDTLVYYFPASEGLLREVVDHLFKGSLAIGFIALLGIIIGANGLFMASNRAVNRLFDNEPRKIVGRTLAQASIATTLAILFMLSIAITVIFQVAINFGGGFIESIGGASGVFVIVSGVLSAVLPAVFTATVFIVVYYYLPNGQIEWRDATFGGMIGVILFETGKHVFFWFTNQAGQSSVIYGPVASFVVLLMWAYIAGWVFLYGAAIVKASMDLRPSE